MLRHAYARAAHTKAEWPWIEALYERAGTLPLLTDVNELFIRAIATRLGVATRISRSTDYKSPAGKNERLLGICEEIGATTYLSGPAAAGYMDLDLWREHGIEVEFKTYDRYPEYTQLHGPFEHGVTILDLFFNVGEDATAYFRQATPA